MKINPMVPTITLKGKDPRFAVYARIFALISVLIFFVVAVLDLLSFSFPSFFFTLLITFNIFLIEENRVDLSFLKNALWRGITYLVLTIVTVGFTNFFFLNFLGLASLALLIAGILDLVYYFN